jgi:hypothetical protein
MPARFQPGDLVRQFAGLYGWPIEERSIVVEGEHDQRYFTLADTLYTKETGMHLLGAKVAVFPTGIGDEGGAFGLQRHFHPLRAIMDRDMTPDGQKVFHAIALFDSDIEGKRGFGSLTGQHLNYRKWRDVFLLQRAIPRTTRDPIQMAQLVDKANHDWRGLDCEIEDLVSSSLINTFLQENPHAVYRQPQQMNGALHCSFQKGSKANFVRFVEENAILQDLSQIVEILKSLRYHLGLQPDGDKA